MSATAAGGRVSLWRTLQSEHDRIWDLLAAITGGPGTGNEVPPPKEQRRLAKRLVRYAAGHELTEELVILPAVGRRCTDGRQLVMRALQQESDLKRALNELGSISAGNEEFTECVDTIAGELRNHLSYEQNQIWPRLADALDERSEQALLQRWRRLRTLAPRRPHPFLPATPRTLELLSPLLSRLG